MLNTAYRLIAPRTFEPVQVELDLALSHVLVRPTHLSICNADQRYYQGTRSEEVLFKKLPMALIHEGIGVVVETTTEDFRPGDKVVMIPNHPQEKDEYAGENYLYSSSFCGSGYDGFMQEYVLLSSDRVLLLPQDMNESVAAFTELISVVMHAITRFERIAHGRRDHIGIWGDGNVGFIVALLLRTLYPQMYIVVFGRNSAKLSDFTFVDEHHLTHLIPEGTQIDHAFECCGGEGSASAIDQIISLIKPEGTISLLGVSENKIAVDTRMVLEKGLRLYGSSRSGRADFERTLDVFSQHHELVNYLESLVGQLVDIKSMADVSCAFELDIRKSMGKTIMRWNV